MSTFPFYKQFDAKDCGAACLRMIAKYYGKSYSLDILRKRSFISREGVSLLGLSEAAESIGFKTLGVRTSFRTFIKAPLPCIVHWKQNHFIVVYDIKINKKDKQLLVEGRPIDTVRGYVKIADPARGLIKYSIDEFLYSWVSSKQDGEEQRDCSFIRNYSRFL